MSRSREISLTPVLPPGKAIGLPQSFAQNHRRRHRDVQRPQSGRTGMRNVASGRAMNLFRRAGRFAPDHAGCRRAGKRNRGRARRRRVVRAATSLRHCCRTPVLESPPGRMALDPAHGRGNPCRRGGKRGRIRESRRVRSGRRRRPGRRKGAASCRRSAGCRAGKGPDRRRRAIGMGLGNGVFRRRASRFLRWR